MTRFLILASATLLISGCTDPGERADDAGSESFEPNNFGFMKIAPPASDTSAAPATTRDLR